MATLGTALSIATSALAADQAAIDISANNTANANTPGYTVESAVWQQQDTVSLNGSGTYGSGVSVTGAASQRDRVLEQRVQQQTQATQQSGARLTTLQQIQSYFNDTATGTGAASTGIGASLTGMFNTFTQLAANPGDGPTRQAVLSAAQTLAQTFNAASAELQQQTSSINQQVAAVVPQVNVLTAQIAGLNKQIMSTSPNGDAGVLEDQRQQAINQLSQYVGLNQIRTESNGLTLTTSNGAVLVSQAQSYDLNTATVGGNTDIVSSTGVDITSGLTGGQLGGALQARGQDIPAIQSQIDTLAFGIATQVNATNSAGVDLNGNPGANVFNVSATASGAAASMSVAITSASQIAAAGVGEGSAGNANATALAGLQNAAIAGGQTVSSFYSTFLTSVGTTVASATTQNSAQQSELTQLTSQRNALSGVTLDQEASNLTQYERAYQAASKVFSIVDSLVASALNLGEPTTVN